MDRLNSDSLPRRPPEHVLGDAAEMAVWNTFPEEWIVRKEESDYGIDLCVEIVRNERVTGCRFLVQVKGIRSGKSHQSSIGLKLKMRSVNYWRKRAERVMVAAHIKDEGVTYWAWADDIPLKSSDTVTFLLPRHQRLDQANWNSFAKDLEAHYRKDVKASIAELGEIRVPKVSDKLLLLTGSSRLNSFRSRGPLSTDCGIYVFRNSSLFELRGTYGLVDCGRESEHGVVKWLQDNSIRHLHFLGVSHFHIDCFGGLGGVLTQLDEIGIILLPPMSLLINVLQNQKISQKPGAVARFLHELLRFYHSGARIYEYSKNVQYFKLAGGDFELDEIGMHVYYPSNNFLDQLAEIAITDRAVRKRLDHNSMCAVFKLSVGQTSFLITGDANRKAWKELIKAADKSGRELKSNGLVLPHHGSRDALSFKILDRLLDGIGCVTVVAPSNFLKKPDEEVLYWVRKKGAILASCEYRPVAVRMGRTGLHLE